MGEDLIVNYHIYLYIHKFGYLNEYLYHYRKKRSGNYLINLMYIINNISSMIYICQKFIKNILI